MSKEMITTTYKIPIVKPISTDWNTFGKVAGDLTHNLIKIMNDTITMQYVHIQKKFKYKEETGKTFKDKDHYGVTFTTVINRTLKGRYENLDLPGDLVGMAIREALDSFKTHSKEMLKGNLTFRRDQPIPVRHRSLKLNEDYTINLPFMTNDLAETYGFKGRSKQSFEVQLGTKGNAKIILDRILNGEYIACDSAVQRNNKGKWFLLLSYKQPVKENILDSETIVGIDLGIAKAAYLAVNNSKKNTFIDGGEVTTYGRKIKARRKSLQNQLRVCSDNRRGRGKRTLLKPLEILSEKESNFRNTTNHRYSKYIVDWSVKQGAGTIQMEDLSGINKENNFLSNWDYYDLQQKIKYKAEKEGIEVIFVNPEYTSQRCNHCGNIHRDNRSHDNQSIFKCITCGHKTNADLNAARNIALEGIEEIVQEQMKIIREKK